MYNHPRDKGIEPSGAILAFSIPYKAAFNDLFSNDFSVWNLAKHKVKLPDIFCIYHSANVTQKIHLQTTLHLFVFFNDILTFPEEIMETRKAAICFLESEATSLETIKKKNQFKK